MDIEKFKSHADIERFESLVHEVHRLRRVVDMVEKGKFRIIIAPDSERCTMDDIYEFNCNGDCPHSLFYNLYDILTGTLRLVESRVKDF